ncbi:MAG: DNA topoisomerase IV subunit A [Methylocystis sp.]|nr:DNA topoisomerase IV subunit A [Methylocystis sp.]MCA3585334.1 DNA topoisomerase IV subunit A [Methylocystis sp.]MCA3589599.1 DNA topoisomerase IV subunit A [Methylocystis sp.]MCA3591541.1 DNA topoisomerase IV subunit A [Methylocystis sp.]
MDDTTPPPGDGGRKDGAGDGVENVSLKAALEERYLAYALSTIMHRALPDARDGLKPVQRRILHAMRLLKLDPANAYKKCASVVGEVIGKFHPHGDQAIYDAMVRLAQDFAQRYMLVDGQGNFGSIDGDNAAAYRYTEAKLTDVAALLLQGIDEDAVDFRPTYNNENDEPVVLPGAFPNMLANGATGIAVGMATSIPPHNAAELCDAALYLIEHPKATSDQLLTFVPGPDFPTGGIIVEPAASIAETYRTGRGGFRLRARWHKEETGRGAYIIVVTEIPYLVRKGALIEALADLINERKVPILADVRDESAEDIRIVLEPKSRAVDETVLMETLFKLTELEARLSMNMNVLADGLVPRVIGLAEALRIWLDHRRVVLQRRSRFRLGEIERRLERLGGLLIAFLNLDEVIRIIREEDEPKPVLIRRFELTDLQAETILDTRLRQLRKLEEMQLRKEFDALTEEKGQIEGLLGDEAKQWKTIAWEIREVRKKFGPDTKIGKRRTTFADKPDSMADIDLSEALVEREPITVVLSEKGWIRSLKGHVSDLTSLQFKSGDKLKHWFHSETTAKLLMLVSNGKVFTLDASRLPGGRGFGDPVRLMADIDEGVEIIRLWPHQAGSKLLMVATGGNDVRGFLAPSDELIATTKKGRNVLNVDGDWKAVLAVPASGDHVAIIGENRKLLCFPLAEVPEMTRGKGVRLQKYKDGNVADAKVFSLADGLTWQSSDGRTYTVARPELDEWIGRRAEAGKLPPRGFPKGNRFG